MGDGVRDCADGSGAVMGEIDFDALAARLPPHPGTGERHSGMTIDRRRERQEFRCAPPSPTGREVWEYSEAVEGVVYVRDKTEEEIAADEAAYERAYAEWQNTGGRLFSAGPVTTTARCEFLSGSSYEAILGPGDEWIIVDATSVCGAGAP